jgi:capsular polysaccharide biosynthesis protein
MLTSALPKLLRHLPLSSEIFGPPRRFAATTEEWLSSGMPSAAASRHHLVSPTFVQPRARPMMLDGTVPWPFEWYFGGLTSQDPPGWVAEIPGGRVAGNGVVITPNDCLLGDVSRELIVGGDQSKHSVLRRTWLRPVQRVRGRVAVLSVTDVNYWHWFFDLLPRILLLEALPGGLDAIDAFVVNEFRHSYQRETLERLGFPIERIVHSDSYHFHLKADVLLVPSVFVEVPTRWACQALRSRFTRGRRPSGSARLYVSRSDATIRRVVNEDALVAELARCGFERVVLRGKSLAEQIELFSSADFIVAPHGAGLTNTLFCPPGTGILEIYPPNYVNPCYWVLTQHLNLDYYCSIGEGSVPPPPPPGANWDEWFWSFIDGSRTGQDVVARIDDVLALLDCALRDRSVNPARWLPVTNAS